MYFDGDTKASLYCTFKRPLEKCENRFGPSPTLCTSSFDKKCKFALVNRRSAGPPLARGPIRRNRSNRLKTGPDDYLTLLDKNWILQSPLFQWYQKKTSQRFVRAIQALCTLWLPWKTQQIQGPNCFTNTDKNITFLLAEPTPDMRNLWYSYGDLCDMLPTVYWPNNKQIFYEIISAPSDRSIWKKPDNRDGKLASTRQCSVSIITYPWSLHCYVCKKTVLTIWIPVK